MGLFSSPGKSQSRAIRICMHVLTTARTDQRVMREATALVKAGYDVTIVDMERNATRPREETLQGVTLKHIVTPSRFNRTRFNPIYLAQMAGMVMRGVWAVLGTPADVYHAHDDTAFPACYVAARVRRKKLVFDAHELPLVQPNLTRWRSLTALARWALRRMVPRCNGIITVSPPIAAEIHRRYGGPPATLVRNIPPYTPPLTSNRLREMLHLDNETKIAVYQGGIQENRSLEVLVYAARYLAANDRIVLMGDGESKAMLQGLIDREGVGDRIQIIPPVSYQDLIAATASADVGLIVYRGSYSPNVQMCLPNKLFEYVMAGTPIIASELDAVAEIIRSYDVGAITPSLAPEVVGPAISALLADSEGRARMRRNALAAARQIFRWDIEQLSLLNLYASILGTPQASAADLMEPTLPRMTRVQ